MIRSLYYPTAAMFAIITAFCVVALAGFSGPIDLHLHDTYFVIDNYGTLLALLFGPVFLIEALLYYFTRKFRQWRWLQSVHIACTTVALALLVVISLYAPQWLGKVQEARQYADYNSWNAAREAQYPVQLAVTAAFMFGLFFLGQLAFVVNLIAGFIRGRRQ
ncbi:hypothetical protein ACWKWU_08105 [Chitinophaga lutea]